MVETPSDLGHIGFQGKDPGEIFQFYFRQHWIRMVPPLAGMIALDLLLLAIGYQLFVIVGIDDANSRHIIAATLSLFFFLTQWEFIGRFYRYFLYVTIVTDKKVHRIKKTLLAIDMHESVDLWLLQDISKSQRGLIQNIFGFGTLILEGQNQSMLRIHFTPHIAQNHARFMHLRERARTVDAQRQPLLSLQSRFAFRRPSPLLHYPHEPTARDQRGNS